MAQFAPAFAATMLNEGFPGYNIDNNGAEVCAGINRAYWPKWGGWSIIDALHNKGLDRRGINATLRTDPKFQPLVEDFYRTNFWAPSRDNIASQSVANWLFDKSVNMGINQAVKLVQRAAGVTDDGQFGPATLAAINATDPAQLVKAAHNQAVKFYQALHDKDPIKYPADMVNRA